MFRELIGEINEPSQVKTFLLHYSGVKKNYEFTCLKVFRDHCGNYSKNKNRQHYNTTYCDDHELPYFRC